jgi:hypothetical protein
MTGSAKQSSATLEDWLFRARWQPVVGASRFVLSSAGLAKTLLHRPTGQLPGLSQGAGVDRVVAVASAETGPSTPLTTAETRQRKVDPGVKPESPKLGPATLPTAANTPSVPARETR